MPPKRAVEASKSTEECTLHYGQNSNIIKWREHMQTIATELYGIVGMFFTTNMRYEQARLTYRDDPADSSEESSSSDSEDEASDAEKAVADPAQLAALALEKAERSADREVRNARRRKASEKARANFRVDDYIQ